MYRTFEQYNDREEDKRASSGNSSVKKDRPRITYDLMNTEDFLRVLPEIPIIVVQAWASWCQPCKRASEKFEDLGYRLEPYLLQQKILLLRDNIDNEETSHHRMMVDVVPSFFVYVNGSLAKLFTGVDFQEMASFVLGLCEDRQVDAPQPHPSGNGPPPSASFRR